MNKSGKGNFGELFALGVVLLAVILLAPAATQWGNSLFAIGGGTDVASQPIQKIEVVTEKACGSTTMAVSFEVKHKAGTSVTAQNGTVFVDGKKKGVFSEGGTFTANGGNNLNIYYTIFVIYI